MVARSTALLDGQKHPTAAAIWLTHRSVLRSRSPACSINVANPGSGASVGALPADTTAGVAYQQALTAGFIQPGEYIIAAPGGPIGFSGTLFVGSPIQIQTALPPGTKFDASAGQPFTVNWTGGDTGTLVKVTLQSVNPVNPALAYIYADASAGSITFYPFCTEIEHRPFCTMGPLSSAPDIDVIVEVSPYPANTTMIPSPGLTGGIYATWTYRYVFTGLTIG